jgi:hypothetical protein
MNLPLDDNSSPCFGYAYSMCGLANIGGFLYDTHRYAIMAFDFPYHCRMGNSFNLRNLVRKSARMQQTKNTYN